MIFNSNLNVPIYFLQFFLFFYLLLRSIKFVLDRRVFVFFSGLDFDDFMAWIYMLHALPELYSRLSLDEVGDFP